ncbi:hypothetical protein ASPZODRAFT_26039 [Penicilliopsis zonata CBS 506.65]|uniref:Uncharacterized protein n=1 Tax=Penicilliopsis zonata CBS 506.65 TaxID=1073090 RepID=A0A1L9SGI0_9EURO|nr:hypothetical protein ASPZODRAFT_26039 [Penicilliopsis zonata CBS 506.65]OJJ46154.1 hypothetical protein ASPZODRAFT_26039 [Penicilliopsis zonata CBS 506.65]
MISLLLLASLALASNSCFRNAYNASGSISLPYPSPPVSSASSTSSASGNYSLFTTLDVTNSSETSWQYFGLQTSNGDPLPSLSYEGCLIVLSDFDEGAPITTKYENTASEQSCSAFLSSKCRASILSSINSTALSFSQNGSPKSPCGEMTTLPTDGCPSYEALTAEIFGKSQNCTTTFGIGASGNTTSWYLKQLDSALPVIVTAWNNASQNGEESWADTQLMCITPDKVVAGSLQSSAGISLKRSSMNALVLSAFLIFFLW